MLISNRRPLVAVAFTSAILHAAAIVVVFAQPSMTIIDNGLGSKGVQIRGVESARFTEDMTRLARNRQLPRLDAVLSYSAVIENTSSLPLVAVVVRYELVDSTGNKSYETIVINEFDLESASRQMPPTAIRYVGPSRLARMVLNSKQLPPPHVLRALESEAIEVGSKLANLREVRIVLDSVVFADGSMFGPDSLGAIDRFNAWLQAESDLLRSLDSIRGGPMAEERAVELLRSRAASGHTSSSPYSQRQAALADALLNWHRVGGGAELFKQAELIARRPRLERILRAPK